MNTAQLILTLSKQDDKMLSCRRWIVSIMLFNFNLVILFVFALMLISPKTQAIETQSGAAKINYEMENWLEAKNVKYSKYKINYPKEGIIHAKGFQNVNNRLIKVNILELNAKINPNLEIKPQIPSNRLHSRMKIKTIAEKSNAIIAVNGGYFKPETGTPLGALMIDGELLCGQIYDRVGLGINSDRTFSMGATNIKYSLKNRRTNFKIDNINQPRMLSSYTILYNQKWGDYSPEPPKNGINIVFEKGIITGVHSKKTQIPKNGFVISTPKSKGEELLGKGKLELEIIYPNHFDKSAHIISGGPYLVKDGEIFVDTKEEKLTAITGKNPRTLVGYTSNDDLVIVTIDGREKNSVGMNLYEAARFMKSLGCVQAMNLDGGSSTVMYVNGQITNAPPVEGGIPVSSILTVGVYDTITMN